MRTLRNAIEHDQLRQAYLFAGPRGTGKTSMARILAKALNCAQGPTATPDKVCHACVSIANGTSLDVIEMDAASQRGIDDIREIRERVVLQPAEGRYKVYILDEAHQLTDAAWNALLKLIEEPPPHLVFVFCTTDLAKVLPTVRSRCQTFVFPRPRLPSSCASCGASRRRGDRGARRGARADRPRRARLVPRRGLDARPARRGDENVDRRPVRPPAPRRRRGGLALPPLRHGRRPRHGRRARLRRGARGAGPGPRPARHRPARAPAPPAARPAPGRRARVAARHRGDARAAARAGEPAARADRAAADRPARGGGRGLRQGGDPRLPLELALVKVTRPGADLSRESLAHRVELLEQRLAGRRLLASAQQRATPVAPQPEPEPSADLAESAPHRSRRRRSRSTSSRTPGSEPCSPPCGSARSRLRRSSARRARPRSRATR